MKVGEIRTFYQYLSWAHDRMMAVVAKLSPDEFTRELGGGHGSVRDTLVHMMSSEWLWLSRWHGVFPTARLDIDSFPTVESLEERWAGIRRELNHFLMRVRDEDLPRQLTYRNLKGDEISLPLEFSMQHLVNHASYHRGQVAFQLRLLGHEPPLTDLFLYYIEEHVLSESGQQPATFAVSSFDDEDAPEERD